MNDRVLEVEVGRRCACQCARYRERRGLVGEISRFARRSCLNLTSEPGNPRSSSGAQHLGANNSGRRTRRLSSIIRAVPANRSVTDPLSSEKCWNTELQLQSKRVLYLVRTIRRATHLM